MEPNRRSGSSARSDHCVGPRISLHAVLGLCLWKGLRLVRNGSRTHAYRFARIVSHCSTVPHKPACMDTLARTGSHTPLTQISYGGVSRVRSHTLLRSTQNDYKRKVATSGSICKRIESTQLGNGPRAGRWASHTRTDHGQVRTREGCAMGCAATVVCYH